MRQRALTINTFLYIPFAFDTFGFLAPDAIDLLKRIQKVMHSSVVSPKSVNVVFQRLSFGIKKSLAVQLVVGLSFIQM
jgi:hypothetical protein